MGHLNSSIRREMIYVVKYKPFLDLLSISHPIQRQALLNSTSVEQVRCLCNCLENIPYQEDKLRPFERELAELTDRNSSFKRKKQILVQRGGGFLGPILHAPAELKKKCWSRRV